MVCMSSNYQLNWLGVVVEVISWKIYYSSSLFLSRIMELVVVVAFWMHAAKLADCSLAVSKRKTTFASIHMEREGRRRKKEKKCRLPSAAFAGKKIRFWMRAFWDIMAMQLGAIHSLPLVPLGSYTMSYINLNISLACCFRTRGTHIHNYIYAHRWVHIYCIRNIYSRAIA